MPSDVKPQEDNTALLTDKVAIVTGAGRGIGRATALLFAAEGAKVIVNDNGAGFGEASPDADVAQRVVAEIEAAGGDAQASQHDVSDSGQAEALVEQAVASYGQVDILINNAGTLQDRGILKLSDVEWDQVLANNLSATFFALRAAARQMKQQGTGGSIVNTTSRAGLLGNYGQTNYSAATAGVYGLTRTASVELQRHRVRVNAVAPLAKTRLTEQLTIFQSVDSMGPEHVAPVHLFLASQLADDVSGQVLGVAGGKISAYRLSESVGVFKDQEAGAWKAREIAEHWGSIAKA